MAFSSPAIPGILIGVGNVGETLLPYTDSDTFFSRDGGTTWQEIHKDAHLWEFGDSGSVLVLVNDEEPTDKVLYSTDEGDSWKEYNFGRKLRIRTLRNVPSDTGRKFIMYGHPVSSERTWIAVHLDFTSLTSVKCECLIAAHVLADCTDRDCIEGVLDGQNPDNDDFEFWSSADGRSEACLFGRQVCFRCARFVLTL